jgi:hypothetical protein
VSLPRRYNTVYIARAATTDSGLDLEGFVIAEHHRSLADAGYAAVGDVEIRRDDDAILAWFDPPSTPVARIFTVSETAVSWRADA